jgi:hypothetical protein
VPGGEVSTTDGDSLKWTNTENRCRSALVLESRLRREGYDLVNFFGTGTADHPGQVEATGNLIAQYIRACKPDAIVAVDDTAWDTSGNVKALRRYLSARGWWPKGRRPRCDIYVASEEGHTRRIWVLFFRLYGVTINRQVTGDSLTPEEQRKERFYFCLTCMPFSEYPMSWYAKRQRQAVRAAADS